MNRHDAAAQSLVAARALTSAILEAALDAIIAIDERGFIIEFNPAAEKLLGHARSDAVGRELAELIIPPALRDAHRAGLMRYNASGKENILGRLLELPALRADGTEVVVEVSITRAPMEATVFAAFLRDITERKRIDNDLKLARLDAEAANRAKSDFLGALSHDLRTPLNAIGGYVDLMTEGIRGPITAAQREDLERIKKNQRLLLALVNDILNFAKIEAGRLEVRSDRLGVTEILESLEPLVLPQLRNKGLVEGWRVSGEDGYVMGDRDRIQQVMMNLITNAIKFTPSGGSVSIGATIGDETIDLWVRDTGEGISEDMLDDIFEPFIRVERHADEGIQGSGLGLAISHDLALAMGGSLRVESTVGVGSVFTLSLRRA